MGSKSEFGFASGGWLANVTRNAASRQLFMRMAQDPRDYDENSRNLRVDGEYLEEAASAIV